MAEIWANFSGASYLEKEMEMARSHLTEAFLYYHKESLDLESSRESSLDLESSSESKERSTTEHLETFARSRNKAHGLERDAQDRRLWRETVDGLCS